MVFPPLTWVLLIVAAALCAIGFIKFVWFMSVGYGLAVGGIGVAVFLIAVIRGDLTPVMAVLCCLLLVYGLRLGLFLLIREMKSAAYRKTLNAQTDKPVPIFVKFFMWIFMAVLYVMEASAVWYREATAPNGPQLTAWIGAAVMLCGILIEALADKQKSAAKKIAPNRPAMDGLYKISRCPNYFGEITFWTGVFISGWSILKGWQWLIHDQRGTASRKAPEQELRESPRVSGLREKDPDPRPVHPSLSSGKGEIRIRHVSPHGNRRLHSCFVLYRLSHHDPARIICYNEQGSVRTAFRWHDHGDRGRPHEGDLEAPVRAWRLRF